MKDTRILTTPDTITTTEELQRIADEAERIAAEEAECWRQYNAEKKAEEARVQAEIDAAYAERGMEDVVYTDDAAEPQREARRARRDGKKASKERLKKNAEDAAASLSKIKKEVAKAKSATKKEQEKAAARQTQRTRSLHARRVTRSDPITDTVWTTLASGVEKRISRERVSSSRQKHNRSANIAYLETSKNGL